MGTVRAFIRWICIYNELIASTRDCIYHQQRRLPSAMWGLSSSSQLEVLKARDEDFRNQKEERQPLLQSASFPWGVQLHLGQSFLCAATLQSWANAYNTSLYIYLLNSASLENLIKAPSPLPSPSFSHALNTDVFPRLRKLYPEGKSIPLGGCGWEGGRIREETASWEPLQPPAGLLNLPPGIRMSVQGQAICTPCIW